MTLIKRYAGRSAPRGHRAGALPAVSVTAGGHGDAGIERVQAVLPRNRSIGRGTGIARS
jgi:hypothetical protein